MFASLTDDPESAKAVGKYHAVAAQSGRLLAMFRPMLGSMGFDLPAGAQLPTLDTISIMLQAILLRADNGKIRAFADKYILWLQQAVALDDAATADNGDGPSEPGRDSVTQPGEGAVSGDHGEREVRSQVASGPALDRDAQEPPRTDPGQQAAISNGEVLEWLARVTPVQEVAQGASPTGELPVAAAKPRRRAKAGVAAGGQNSGSPDHGPAAHATA